MKLRALHPRLSPILCLLMLISPLAGCGSDGPAGPEGEGGDTGPHMGYETVAGTIEAPTGVMPARVTTSLGSAAVSGGAFAVEKFDAGRQLAVATSAAGNPMLLGWLGAGHTALSPRTTVEALVFYAAGAFALPSEAQLALLDDLATLTELDGLAANYAALLAADPDALAATPASFIAEVQAVLDAMAEEGSARAKGVLVQEGAKSGLRVDTVTGINSITLTNTYRRLCHAYVDRVSTVDENGVETPSPAPLTDFEMPAVQGLGSTIGTFIDIIWGRFAYQERSVDPLPLPSVEGAARTRYKLTVVGPGVSNGDFSQLTNAQVSKQQEVVQTFVMRDLVLPLVLSVLIPNSNLDEYLRFVGGADVVQDFVGILTSAAPGIWDQAYSGDVAGAMNTAYNTILGSGTVRDVFLQKVVDLITDMKGFDAADIAVGRAQSFIKIMTALDMFLAGFDATAVGAAMVGSSRADVWEVDVTPPKVILTPESAWVAFDDTVEFTVTVPEAGGSGTNLVYKWSTEGEFGRLEDSIPGHVNTFDSTRDEATYTAGRDGGVGTEVVRVEVYALTGPAQSERQLVGEAAATLQVRASVVTISPTLTSIQSGDQATFTVTVQPEPEEGTLTYEWFTRGQRGALVPQEEGSTAIYTAELTAEGDESITCGVRHHLDGETVYLGSGSATVTVRPLSAIRTTSRLHEALGEGYQDGYYSYLFVYGYVFHHTEGVREYEMTVVERSGNPNSLLEVGDVRYLHDPDLYGRGSRWYDSEDLAEAYGSDVLGLEEGEIAYVYAWQPTPNLDLETIEEFLPIWQESVLGNMEMVFEVLPVD